MPGSAVAYHDPVSGRLHIIDETMLIMDMQAILKYVEQTQMVLTEAQKQRLSRETGGMAFALCVAMSMYYELGYTNGLTDSEYDEYSRKVTEQMWNYLEFHVYDKWDIRMQEFLMKISIVDTFTVRLAEMITEQMMQKSDRTCKMDG